MVQQYGEIRALLAEGLLEIFPQAVGDEIDAAVTHWLQAQEQELPFLTPSMRKHCATILETFNRIHTNPRSAMKPESRSQTKVNLDWGNIPFPPVKAPKFKFIDLFAGIGGFRIAMQEHGGKCVFSSEWDPNAKKTYEANFGEIPYGDIRKIDENTIPDHDVLCAGFPCQPFSRAGVSSRNSLNTAHGFACEDQGNLFFDIVRILRVKKPRIAFLENVRNLVGHDGGKTFEIIEETIRSIGYSFSYRLIDSSPLVPQKRIRCYMICERKNQKVFHFPKIEGPPLALKTILENRVDDSFTISEKLWAGHQRRSARNIARGVGFTAFCVDIEKPSNTIVARYGKDGKECLIPQLRRNPRMLTPRECARLQGFPEIFIIPAAKTTAYRQFGNSVAIPVIRKITENIVQALKIKSRKS